MKYAYFPGCSSGATAASLGLSVHAVAEPLGIELIELEGWNCCGSTPYVSLHEAEATVVAARNLALADRAGMDLVTPCNSCFVTLQEASSRLKQHPGLARQVNEALASVNLKYEGKVRVRHLMDVLIKDVTLEAIAARAQQKLNGLKVAAYYGCQLVRPDYGYDNPEFPQSLDRLVKALGGEPVAFAMRNRCCGGSLIISEEDIALGLIRRLLDSASKNGAQCLVTPCPLCQVNLDAYQPTVNRRFGTSFNLPVLFVTQLIGLALKIEPDGLGLERNIVSSRSVLAHLNKVEQVVKSGA